MTTLRENLMNHLRQCGAPIDFAASILAYVEAAGGDLDRTVTAQEFGKLVVKHTAALTGVPVESLQFDWTPKDEKVAAPAERPAAPDEFPEFIGDGDTPR